MIGGNIVNIIASTLHSNTTQHSAQQLHQIRQNKGFTIQLLLISDDPQYEISIRQAALIYLKNTIQDHSNYHPLIHPEDLGSLKASILLALIRSISNNKLAPTYRQIIYQLAEKYYPREWPEIVAQALAFIERATDFSQLHGSVQALKTLFSVFGKSMSKEIQLSNLSNQTILPILHLASKLFQSFNQDTSVILISIFKLICTAISFHIPPIFEKNIHSLMIFIKKILDLKVSIEGPQYYSFYLLKKLSLRIIFRIYQKHANPRFTNNKSFADLFHSRYTKAFVETLILQILECNQASDRQSKSKYIELVKFALSCLAYINNQHPQSAHLLQVHRNSLLNLCLSKFRINLNKHHRSFHDFRQYVHSNRVHMKQFLFSILRCDAIPERQEENMGSILTLLLECIKNGDNELKELALYLFTQMSSEIKTLRVNIQQRIGVMIGTQIKNLLTADHHVLVRARACNLIASYNDIDLPEDNLSEISMLVYNCLLVGDAEKETFLKVYACNAFNSLLKYNQIYQHIKPHLQQILKIYTQLLQVDVTIIKNVEDLLDLLQDEIAPFANDLVSLLIGHFIFYSSKQNNQAQRYADLSNSEQLEEDEDVDEDEQCQQSNNETIAKAMVSSIRQILQSQSTIINHVNSEQLFNIVIKILSDPSQLYLEEGFNILNLLLYKLKEHVNPKYYIFLKVIIYAILGVPTEYINHLSQGNHFDKSFAQILNNICVDPDSDIIENSIGSLRNFIAKSDFNALRHQKDHFGITFIDYFFKLVKTVHENLDKKHSQTDRLIILTIYTTLVQYKMMTEDQLSVLMRQILQWMQMEIEVVEAQKKTLSFGSAVKYTYTPVYLQIIMLCIFNYGKTASSKFNISFVVQTMLQIKQSFRCDYQISRVIVGIASLLKLQQTLDAMMTRDLMNSIPGFVFQLCKLRQEGDRPENDIEMDDEAEEQRFFGEDDNSMMIGWGSNRGATPKDLLLSKEAQEEDEQEDDDWQKQFNKYYESTLDSIDEIKMLELVLKEEGNQFCQFMDLNKQQELSLYLSNAPPKQFS